MRVDDQSGRDPLPRRCRRPAVPAGTGRKPAARAPLRSERVRPPAGRVAERAPPLAHFALCTLRFAVGLVSALPPAPANLDVPWPHGQALLDEIERTTPGAGSLALWHIGQSGFVVRAAGSTLVFDPFLAPSNERQ